MEKSGIAANSLYCELIDMRGFASHIKNPIVARRFMHILKLNCANLKTICEEKEIALDEVN
jgi:hypothetical protein